MDATALLARVRANGVEVTASGDLLRCRPHERLTTELFQELLWQKQDVLRALAAETERFRLADEVLTLGATLDYPRLPFKAATSIAAGGRYWRMFQRTASSDDLRQASEAAQVLLSQRTARPRCVIAGCRQSRAQGDIVYCTRHRVMADSGELWGVGQDAEDNVDVASGESQVGCGDRDVGSHDRPSDA